MATPTSNSILAFTYAIPGDNAIASLTYGTKWGSNLPGVGVTLTYSFPDVGATYAPGYGDNEPSGLSALSPSEQITAMNALSTWAGVANLNFVSSVDNATTVGEIRIAQSTVVDSSPEAAGWAYLPANVPESGDVWLSPTVYSSDASPGFFDLFGLIHETGHALGLKHPFETSPYSSATLPASEDYLHYSVMSYSSLPSQQYHYISMLPTTPMIDDIRAMQYIYGANMSWHVGNDTYVYTSSGKYFETIWDAGGNDTIRYDSTTAGGLIDLRAGHFSNLGQPIVYSSDGTTIAAVRYDTVAIAYGTTIENAIGSQFNDTLIGNDADNTLDGGGSADTMSGGLGNDTFFVDHPGDVVIENASEGTDTVESSVSYTLPSNVENLYLLGSSNINGTGNAAANVLVGNPGTNVLTGGAGDDVYFVQNTSDSAVEQAGQGNDTVFSNVDFTLGANVENLTLLGSANINGTGNSLDNTLAGNTGVDMLTGGGGNDTYVVHNSADTIVEAPGGGTDIVTSDASFTLPANAEHIFLLGTGNINATGNDLQNVIVGNLGTNTLAGGLGDDIYFVQAPNASIVENPGEGRDTVFSYLDFTLPANVEDLYLQGTGDLHATGNSLTNVLKGTDGANWLDGQGGNDVLIGLGGDDVYWVDSTGDEVVEQAGQGTDTVLSTASFTLDANVENLTLQGSANLTGTGNGLDNTLVANDGIDTLVGLGGNDTYVVYNAADSIVENPGGGTDIVTSTASYTLPANVEHIFLLGAGNINATGNDLQNVIVGNLGTNTLTGGLGDDIYFVQAPNATIVENPGEGRDTVFSYVNFTLGANVEDLYLQGSANINATGNGLANVLKGNDAANVIDGQGGNDVLYGAGGDDTFVFDAASGIDQIADFGDVAGNQDLVNLTAFATNFGALSFSVVGGAVEMDIAGVDPTLFHVNFSGYASTANFGADDFIFA
jgi:serralysin